jgi:hypothetical protein
MRRVPFPPERCLVLDTLHLGRDKPMMHGLIELDVTRASCSTKLGSLWPVARSAAWDGRCAKRDELRV